MKYIPIFLFIMFYTAIISRYYYMSGINDANFDREVAVKKLIQCHDLITRAK